MGPGPVKRADESPPTLWRHRDFVKLWIGQSISVFGSQFTGIALPIVALQLGANAVQFGILNALETVPFLLFGLFVGVWVDRWPRRPILIVGDLGRGLIVIAIALLFLAGSLRLVHLFLAGFLTGVLTVFFDVAYQAYVPSLVEPEQLVDANGKLETTRAASQVAGPGIGGVIVSLLSAAAAMILDGATFFVSGAFLVAIRGKEHPPEKKRASMIADVREGLGVVFGDPRLRAIAGCTATSNFFNSALSAVLVLFMAVDLGYSPTILAGVLGLVFSLGSIGALVGAVVAGRTAKRIGVGNAIVAGAVLFSLSIGFIAVAFQPYAIPMLIAGNFLTLVGALIYNVNQVSLRQAITPNRLQGRMNATMRFLVWGTLPLGAITGGILGTVIGLRATLLFALAGGSTAVFWLLASPVPALRTIPAITK
ncbi:MAG: MFS transporter [Methanobacteriota archaeon]|nr:MAG: MFS transporter [Euryarchaeota archaeon]